ncbi:MAG: DUF456 domain-containing protein [Anaerolineae bacterium]|nr:DUF456 domain-containing protein [Anaerolineae bacterium]
MMDSALLLALQIFVILLMLIGMATLVFPVLPGLTVIWGATLLYVLIVGFNLPGIIILVISTMLMLVGNVVDNVIIGAHVRQSGASWLTVSLALLAGLIGTFVFPPLGGLLAALLVIFLVEVIRLRDWRKALESARSMIMGMGWSTLVRLGIGTVMIFLWIVWAFFIK